MTAAGRDWRWEQVLVIPAYRESPEFLDHMRGFSDTLLILVLNRPGKDRDAACNDPLRRAVERLSAEASLENANGRLFSWAPGSHILLVERPDPLPTGEGVGLARKIGCDLALALYASNCLASPWIHSSDADARLPGDYFAVAGQFPKAVALTYPFRHARPAEARRRAAMDLYERRLHSYVQGLREAGSPYAFHTIGSCLAVRAEPYARVRGVPRRAGGEDFYLLNKLAKLGVVATPDCAPLCLSARVSDRVPFGTGPALATLLHQDPLDEADVVYHPDSFLALRRLLACIREQGRPGMTCSEIFAALSQQGGAREALEAMGFAAFLEHANRHCADEQAFRKQFHQWFDGFRTLKFVHALEGAKHRLRAWPAAAGSRP